MPPYVSATLVIGERGNLTRQVARRRVREAVRAINALSPQTAVELSIFGYDDDPRELWDVPDSRDYIIAFVEGLLKRGIALERLLPQTQFVIRACYATRAGETVITIGTQEDTVREGVEQVLQHYRATKREVN